MQKQLRATARLNRYRAISEVPTVVAAEAISALTGGAAITKSVGGR